jgi:hypothetical protein
MAEIEQNRVFGFFRGFRETFKKILKISAMLEHCVAQKTAFASFRVFCIILNFISKTLSDRKFTPFDNLSKF